MPAHFAVLVLAFLSGLTTLVGVALASYFKESTKGIAIGMGFSAGMMLMISFFELIPESMDALGVKEVSITTFFGILSIAALHFIIPHTHIDEERGKLGSTLLRTAYLVVLGLILHDFPEGFAMASSFIFSPNLGILVAVATAIHNIPEEFTMAIPIVLVKKKSFLFKAAFLSGLAEPVGAAIGLFAVHFSPALNPLLMSFAASAMIFCSVHELLPIARREKKTSFFVLGMVLSVLVYLGLTMLIPE